MIKSFFLLKATLTSLIATPGRQYYGKRHPAPAGTSANIHQEPLSVQSSLQLELGKGSRCHTDRAPHSSQAEQRVFSVSDTTGEEKITSKSFPTVSKIKLGLAYKAQQMSQEAAATQNIWWWPKAAQWSAASHLKSFHSCLTCGSRDRAVSSHTSSKSLEVQHGLLPSIYYLLQHL